MNGASGTTGPPAFADHRRHADAIIAAVLEAADPARAVARAWPGDLGDSTPTVLIAVGKASIEMARAALDHPGFRVRDGLVIAVPERAARAKLPGPVRIMPADHPLPTQRNVEAARAVETLGRSVRPGDRVLMLISGGGSAHLTLPAEGLSLDDLSAVTKALQRAGAPIRELNTVRKHLEQLKGGRLAALMPGAEIRALILSDVLGDPLDVIASGPVSPDPTAFADALAVLDRCGAMGVSPAATAHLQRGAGGALTETPKPGDACFARVSTAIIAGNTDVVNAAARAAESLGFAVVEQRGGVEGPAADAGRALAARLLKVGPGSAVVVGGETTVDVRGASGTGGPSQELALAAAIELDRHDGIAVLTFSTDGVDGPTDAAGAVITGSTAAQLRSCGVDPARALRDHDSHAALQKAGALLRTGPTGTNVNHIAVGLRYGVV